VQNYNEPLFTVATATDYSFLSYTDCKERKMLIVTPALVQTVNGRIFCQLFLTKNPKAKDLTCELDNSSK